MPRPLFALLAALLLTAPAIAGEKTATVYKTPWCGCCKGYVKHMREQGWQVETKDLQDLAMVKKIMGVGETMQSCHTVTVGDYVVEGHVPLEYVDRMLAEKPDIRGIALPGMPTGVPGMEGKRVPITIYTLEAEPKVYATRK
jgi:hypothetical protein